MATNKTKPTEPHPLADMLKACADDASTASTPREAAQKVLTCFATKLIAVTLGPDPASPISSPPPAEVTAGESVSRAPKTA